MVREKKKFFKVREFYFQSEKKGKKEKSEKIEFNMTDLMQGWKKYLGSL